MTTKKRLLLGAHMSISGGMEKSIERGQSIECTTIQIFTKSNRQWRAKPLTDQEISLFVKTAAHSSINPIIAHASYLINIASPDPKNAATSLGALADELERCQQLSIPYLVLHPGAYSSSSDQEGIARIIENINHVFEKVPGTTIISLETMAGQGTSLSATFEQIATIINGITHQKRIGVCLDTCHVFAAGYDLRTDEAYRKTWEQFKKIIGLEKLNVIHVNDSKKELGTRIDRHEHIGKGALGLNAFKLLFNDERFFDVPKILETPKTTEDPFTDDIMNMETIKSLLTSETRRILNV